MANCSRDWFNQGLRDLEQAEDFAQAGRHEWACFAAQQAAEKAVKALHLHFGQESWGHVVVQLLHELPILVVVPPDLAEKRGVLDNFYIPTRYANSHPVRAPYEHYRLLQSRETIQYACEIVEFVRLQIA
ncbi:MAG: HEPN domain-containing protein [Anaerolineae bacterium]|nr:HEPN domain-containing protein [Anaerolineae bacterium]MDW8098871.1 HEPN domain-containing protein [Anaerolineae bacterium]